MILQMATNIRFHHAEGDDPRFQIALRIRNDSNRMCPTDPAHIKDLDSRFLSYCQICGKTLHDKIRVPGNGWDWENVWQIYWCDSSKTKESKSDLTKLALKAMQITENDIKGMKEKGGFREGEFPNKNGQVEYMAFKDSLASRTNNWGITIENPRRLIEVFRQPSRGHPLISIEESKGVFFIGMGPCKYALVDTARLPKAIKGIPLLVDRDFSLEQSVQELPIRALMAGGWAVVHSNKRILVEDIRALVIHNDPPPPAYKKIFGDRESICPGIVCQLIDPPEKGESKENIKSIRIHWLVTTSSGDVILHQAVLGPEQGFAEEREERIFDNSLGNPNRWPVLVGARVYPPVSAGIMQGGAASLPSSSDEFLVIATSIEAALVRINQQDGKISILSHFKPPDNMQFVESAYDTNAGGLVCRDIIDGNSIGKGLWWTIGLADQNGNKRKSFAQFMRIDSKDNDKPHLEEEYEVNDDEIPIGVVDSDGIPMFLNMSGSKLIFRPLSGIDVREVNYKEILAKPLTSSIREGFLILSVNPGEQPGESHIFTKSGGQPLVLPTDFHLDRTSPLSTIRLGIIDNQLKIIMLKR